MSYGYRAAAATGPNWAAMRDVAREGDWMERAIHATSGTAAATDVQAGITDLQHAAAYWVKDGNPTEASRVQTVVDQLQAYAAAAPGLAGQDLADWQARLYSYQQQPRAAWRLYLDASGEIDVAVAAAVVVETAAIYWIGAVAGGVAFSAAVFGGWLGVRLAQREGRRGG